MNFYQEKWIDLLNKAHLQGWKIEPRGNDIFIEMPNITDIKLIRDNIPLTLAAMSLDITEPKERLNFIFHNGHEQFEYLLNPVEGDLEREWWDLFEPVTDDNSNNAKGPFDFVAIFRFRNYQVNSKYPKYRCTPIWTLILVFDAGVINF